jgi:hypothetical protein
MLPLLSAGCVCRRVLTVSLLRLPGQWSNARHKALHPTHKGCPASRLATPVPSAPG